MLASCASNTQSAPNYYESAAYFEHLYETQNYTPIQENLVKIGQGQIGTPYVYGGSSPSRGFDCSGFTQYVYKNAIGVNLPRTARKQSAIGQYIPRQYILPGDLIIMDLVGDKSHVGIYIGEGKFFHASTSRGRLTVADMNSPYFSPRYDSSVRVLH